MAVVRVAQVIGGMNLGGAESMIMNLYRRIDKTKVQFDFLVQAPSRCAYDDEIENLGGHIYHISRFKGYNSLKFYSEARDFFHTHKEIQIAHGHIGSSAALYLSAAKKEGVYTIAHSHSADIVRNIHDIGYKLFSYPTRNIADTLFGCSTEAGVARYGKRSVNKGNYMNFHNAIDLQDFIYNAEKAEEVRRDLHVEGSDVIATIGRVSPPKNPSFIFEIFVEAINKYPNVKCLWIGAGEEYEKYYNQIEALEISDRLIMTGRRDDIPRILQAVDGLILPSLWEGLPVVAIEAQAAGVPCLLSNTISRESKITDLVQWESIKTPASVWAQRIVEMANANRSIRISPILEIQESGYDINTTAEWLCNFYLNHSYRQ